jgi:energy-converting hydrogenase Eha subunit C
MPLDGQVRTMAERTDQRTGTNEDPLDDHADLGPDLDPGPGRPPEETVETATASESVRSRLRSPFGGVFSLSQFLLTLVLTVGAMVLAGTVLPIPGISGLVGIGLVGAVFGLASESSRYLELAVAGATASGVGTLLNYFVLTALGIGVPVVAVGAAAGVVAGVLGHYLGRDLRDGLTRDL